MYCTIYSACTLYMCDSGCGFQRPVSPDEDLLQLVQLGQRTSLNYVCQLLPQHGRHGTVVFTVVLRRGGGREGGRERE